MKFRTGLVVGLGIGFVLGARAGRERYDQIVAAARKIAGDERVKKAATSAERASRPVRSAAGNGMVAAGEKVKELAGS